MTVYKIVLFCFIALSLAGIALSELKDVYPSRTACVKERAPKDKTKGKNYNSKTHFLLFTPKNKEEAELLHKSCNKLPADSNFDEKLPIIIIMHGYSDGVCLHSWMRETKEEFFKRGDYNIILVDWSNRVTGDFATGFRGVAIVGKVVGKLINNIKKQKNVPAELFHLIGHSLGGEMTSYVVKYTEVGRITALDPAGMGYQKLPDTEHLDISDSRNIDVLHTNPGLCLPHFGYKYPIGSADFYFGDGSFQPSCYTYAVEAILKGNTVFAILSLLLPTACAHLFAQDLFKATINPKECQYIAKPCKDYESALNKKCEVDCKKDDKDCAVMGFDWEPKADRKSNESLIYYMDLQLPCPYCPKGSPAADVPKLPKP